MQIYQKGKNVLEAVKERIELIFDNYENIHVSVSGGKDSTVLCHLVLEEAVKRNRRVGIFFLDEEVVYHSTVNQIEYLMTMYPDNIIKMWVQIPFNLTNATSTQESQLLCWEPGKHKLWMRSKDKNNIIAKPWDVSKETIGDKNKGFGFYDAIDNFERCYENTAFFVGLRATESPNRWRSVVKHPVNVNGQDVYWGTNKGKNAAFYPLYDWLFSDIWRYIHDNDLKYSKIYDYQFKKGLPVNEIRVSSLIHEKSFKALCDLPEFEPKTFDKICERIKGMQFAQEAGKDSKMFKCSKLPKNFDSWMKYRDFLLETFADQKNKEIFVKRFSKQYNNEYVARQQCRQLVLDDYENNLPIENKIDPRIELLNYYSENL